MSSDLALIAKTLGSLGPALAEDQCAGCECLQGALVELKLALEELPGDAHHAELLARVETALGRGERHACLGCEPCNPGNILAEYYREQQTREPVPQIACTDG
jgi:hypothetical protein